MADGEWTNSNTRGCMILFGTFTITIGLGFRYGAFVGCVATGAAAIVLAIIDAVYAKITGGDSK